MSLNVPIVSFVSLLPRSIISSYNLFSKNSEENSKRKVPIQMAKLNDKTNQTNGQQFPL